MSTPSAPLRLRYHPFSRAATTVWMLEELGLPYELDYVDFKANEQRSEASRKLNPMGKLPVLLDGETVVTESAAIGLYLADRYSMGKLAPAADDPKRATYLRWSLYAPSVIEPGVYAKTSKWEFRPETTGWGDYETMLDTIETAIGDGPWILGEQFSMADLIFGGTVRFLVQMKMLDARPSFVAYSERLSQRPAAIAAKAINDSYVEKYKLGQ